MLKTTLKGLLAHRVRLIMTALAIVLGVGFVSGTFVYTDTIDRVFVNLVSDGAAGVDVYVRGEAAFDNIGNGQSDERHPVPGGVLDDVRAVDGVDVAAGSVEGYAQIIDKDGDAITPMGPPTLGMSWLPETLNAFSLREGDPPTGPSEVVIDATTADDNDLAVGDTVKVLFAQVAPREFQITGIATYGDANNLAGATSALFDTDTAQEVLSSEGEFSAIQVAAADGVSQQELTDRIAAAVPADLEVQTGEAVTSELTQQIRDQLGFLQIALGIFGAIALFVGAFIIANTFTIVVAQRTREFALLRALGASNRQVTLSVLAEAAIIGLVASAVGVLAGIGLAAGLQTLFTAIGMDLPTGGLVVAGRTVVVGLTVGVVVTVVSSLLPALRASRVEPVAAMRDVASPVRPSSRARTVTASVMVLAGAVMLTYGLVGNVNDPAIVVGIAAALTLFGVGGLAPLIARPVAKVVGAPAASVGMPGRLAQGNAMRTPRRTSATASALMIGLALVSFMAVFASSVKASATSSLDEQLKADLIVSSTNAMTGGGFAPVVADQLREVPEVGALSEIRGGMAAVEGGMTFVTAVNPESWEQIAVTEVTEGTFADLSGPGTLMVDTDLADEQDLAVGDTVDVQFAATGDRALTVTAIYEPSDLLSGWIISPATYEANFAETLDMAVLFRAADGVDTAALRDAVAPVLAEFPNVTVEDRAEYKDTVAGQVDQMLALITALLGMAIVISVLGITNTLFLSVHERTREIGLLRAVGMTRRQVRSMVRWEAVIVSVLGALLGVLVGTTFGWAIVRALAEDGVSTFVLPGGQLAIYVVLAAVAGVLAAVFPARRAAKLDVLRAVTVE